MDYTRLGMWVAIGIAIAVALGAALGNVGLGVAFGPALGIAAWVVESAWREDRGDGGAAPGSGDDAAPGDEDSDSGTTTPGHDA